MGNDMPSVFLSTEFGEGGLGKKFRVALPAHYIVPIRIEQVCTAKYGIQTMHVGHDRIKPRTLQHLRRFLD